MIWIFYPHMGHNAFLRGVQANHCTKFNLVCVIMQLRHSSFREHLAKCTSINCFLTALIIRTLYSKVSKKQGKINTEWQLSYLLTPAVQIHCAASRGQAESNDVSHGPKYPGGRGKHGGGVLPRRGLLHQSTLHSVTVVKPVFITPECQTQKSDNV